MSNCTVIAADGQDFPPPRFLSIAARLLCEQPVSDEADALPEPWRGLASLLAATDFDDRQQALDGWLAGNRDDADAINRALADADPMAPIPVYEPEGEEWPPLRLEEPPEAVPFPADVLPACLEQFCREVAESTRTAIDIPGLGMLTVAGAAIGASVQVGIKRRWTESALLYSVVIASPGRSKTPALRPVVRPLAVIDERLRGESAVRLVEWRESKRAHDKGESEALPGEEPPQLRAITKDITRESLVLVLQDNPRGVLCFQDEALAWTNSWNQYKAKGTDEQFWLSIYSGDPIAVDRKGGRESVHAPHPFAAFLGGIQPRMVRKLRGEDGGENGFLHRLAFAFPDAFPERTWTETEVSEEAERDWTNAIERLHAVEMRSTSDGLQPWVAELRPEAKARFVEWYNANGAAMDEADDDGREGAMAKAEGRMARLALILSRLRRAVDPTRPLVDGDQVPPVELRDMEGAIRLTEYFASHAERVASVITEGAGTADALTLLKWIKRHRPAEFRESRVADDVRRLAKDPAALSDALRALAKAGAIRPKMEPAIPGKRGPKPSQLYEVHPDLR